MAAHNDTGRLGEDMALSFLKEKGYDIVERNYRFARAEVDLICTKDGLVIFIEVKTRTGNYFGYPEVSVNAAKQNLMAKAASQYMYEKQIDSEIRFDIVSITLGKEVHEIMHFEDAFFPIGGPV